MLEFKYGRRKRKDDVMSFPLVALEGGIVKGMENWTLRQFADQLAKQQNIKSGELSLHHIEFSYVRYAKTRKEVE